MKKLTTLVAAVFAATSIWAQTPVNDDCAGLIDLGYAPVCPTDTFTNLNATASDIGFDNNPSCFNGNLASHDVWFQFTCPDTLFDFRISLTGVGLNTINNPEFAIYRGDCTFDGLAELLCAVAMPGETSLYIDVQGLTPGLPYFIRVSDYSVNASPNWGDFNLCIAPIPPASNIDDGGSTLCEGTLYDSGGPDNDYGPDENYTFVICPTQPSACITFNLQYYNIDAGGFFGTDMLSFFDGNSTNAPLIVQLSGQGTAPNSAAAGGSVCYQVQATSGCMTVVFQSDNTVQFEGFEGHWECSQAACPAPEPLSVNTNISPADIVSAVSTPATTVTVTNINCPTDAYGTFSFPSDNNFLGMEKGLILTSGLADNAIGPNSIGSITGFNNAPGDADLDFLSVEQGNGQMSHDACVVELDVFVATDELTFEYTFGSDEYPEYVNSNFNDIFAFLASGPGIVGNPGLGGAKNIAIIPGSNTPVQINSVNNLLNWEYYRNNQLGQVLEYDGLTSDFLGVKKTLTARTDVIPCNTYHLKLAVADRGDFSFDSGVFVSDIKGGTPDIAVQFASGIDYFIEDCSGTGDQLVISLSEPPTVLTTLEVNVSGTATPGLDYVLNIPPVITFQPGQQTLTFPIFPLVDNLIEGTETIVIAISNNFGCGTVVYKTITVNIEDNVQVSVNAGSDTIFVCAGSTLQLDAQGAVNYFWAPPGAVSNPFIGNPTISPANDIWLSVTGTVASCTDVDSVFIKIIDPQISVSAGADTSICLGTSVPLIAANNVNNSGLVWTPAAGLDDPSSPTPTASPTVTTTYTATVSIAGCSVSDNITINVDTLFFPTLTTTDTTVCQNYAVQLANILNNSTTYQWSPASGLDDPEISGPIALPDVTTSYTLTASSSNGYCTQTADVLVTVIAADVDILGDPYKEICLGDTVLLQANAAPTGAEVQWAPAFYLSNPTGPSTNANPDESVTFTATYNVNGCLVRDSVHIRVDSLPNSLINRVQDKAIYCPGDTVYLISQTYEPASFPDIDITWLPVGNQLTPDSNWNMVIIATETLTFSRAVNNRGCIDTASVDVPVAIPPTINITSTPSSVCPGQPVQITATVSPQQSLEWMDETGTLSCTDCPNPIATPLVTTSYQVTAPEADCPAGSSITIQVTPPPALDMAPDQTICLGESVTLNAISQPNVTYTWTSEPAGFTSNEPSPVVSPSTNTKYKVVADNGNCTSEAEVTLNVAFATVNAGGDQTVCQGTPVTLNAAVTGTPGTYFWRPDGQMTQSINVTPAATTVYSVTLAYGEDCVATDTVVISVLPAPMPQVTADTSICRGEAVLLNGNSEAGVSYSWTSNPSGFVSVDAMPTVTPQTTTTYILKASNDVCDVFDSVRVNVAFATIDAGPDQTVCFGDAVDLSATVTGTTGTVVWDPVGKNGLNITETPVQTTTYTATQVYGPDNRCSTADAVTVTVVPGIILTDFTAEPDTSSICEGSELSLSVTVVPASASLVWTENGIAIPNKTTPSVVVVPTVAAGNSASYEVMATDLNGCTASAGPFSILVERCYVLPNAFTPDGDGTNDSFGLGLKGGTITISSFNIYNRWGELVFESMQGKERWDGKFNGKDAPSDVYFYVMKVQFADGREEIFKGDVTLIR
ncbi:MAG: choice-of-anchor L domain-containing protein [Lewinellaceae bacterium]|nr:choice-of-anchor L domain-containing protein [Lewinellaceae bacterium]